MLDDTQLIRAVAFPRYFLDGTLAAEALFRFSNIDEHAKVLSIGLGHLLKDEASLAAFGAATIAAMNDGQAQRAAEGGKTSEPNEFIGYYSSTYGELKRIIDPAHTVVAYWLEEGKIREHGQIEYRSNGSQFETKKDGRRARQLLESRIVKTFVGPFRLGEDFTKDLRPELISIELPVLPATDV